MKSQKNIVRYICLLLTVCSIPVAISAQSNNITDKIWNGVGGKANWDSTRYIMFTVSGNNRHADITGNRQFLLDRESGNVRFEGRLKNENIVALLNVNSGTLNRIYTESGTELQVEDFKDLIPAVIDQYAVDLQTLSLPISLLSARITGEPESKIVNAEKMHRFEYSDFLDTSGSFYINEENGLLRRVEFDGKAYIVDGHRDIGNGLILPTILKSSSDSITYQKVASFTEMEPEKFSEF